MNPSESVSAEAERETVPLTEDEETSSELQDGIGDESEERKDWQLWPPSPKVQIALIAIAFGVFNLILLAIWAIVMVYRF